MGTIYPISEMRSAASSVSEFSDLRIERFGFSLVGECENARDDK